MKPSPEKSPQEVLAGLVERVTYHNQENGFCVLRAKARGHRDIKRRARLGYPTH
jgi:exodeoxyribonuclease V alpha subunit